MDLNSLLPNPNMVYPSEMGVPSPEHVYFNPDPNAPYREDFAGAIVLSGVGPGPRRGKPGPSGHRGAGQRPSTYIKPAIRPQPSTGYCINKLCQLSNPGGCCPGYGCRPSTGLAQGMGTCQRVSGGHVRFS